MSTAYYVNFQDIKCEDLPVEIAYLEDDSQVQIGTRYGNGDRKKVLAMLVREKCGECRPTDLSDKLSIEELSSSNKPYYSKWNKDSAIEFFDTPCRFSWYTPYTFLFWDNVLDDSAVIEDEYGRKMTWLKLKNAIFGPNKSMEESLFSQGTYRSYTVPDDFSKNRCEKKEE